MSIETENDMYERYYEYYNYSQYDEDYNENGYWENLDFVEQKGVQKINTYFPPTLMFVGTICNIVCSVTLAKLIKKTISTCIYLCILAVVDTLLLHFRSWNVWLQEMFQLNMNLHVLNRSTAVCQVYIFISGFLQHLCPWLLAAAMLETTLVVRKPNEAHRVCSSERTKNAVLLMILLLVCVNGHVFWTWGLEEDHRLERHYCSFTKYGNLDSEFFRETFWPVMDRLLSIFLPSSVIFVCVLLIARRQHCARRTINSDAILENQFLLNASATYQFANVCLALGVCHIVFSLPETGFSVYTYVFERLPEHLTRPLQDSVIFWAQQNFAEALCGAIRDLFLSLKIVIYLAMWTVFKQELRIMCKSSNSNEAPCCCCCCCCTRDNMLLSQVEDTSSTPDNRTVIHTVI